MPLPKAKSRLCNRIIATREQLERAVNIAKNNGKERRPSRITYHSNVVQDKILRYCRTGLIENSSRCHSIPTKTQMFLLHMKRAVFKHDWTMAARCLQNITKLGILDPAPSNAAWRVLMLILLNHPASKESIVLELMEDILKISNESEIEMYIMRLLTLPPNLAEYDIKGRGKVHNSYYDDDDDISFIDSD